MQENGHMIMEQLGDLHEDLLAEPSQPLDENFKRLRQAAYKKTHQRRAYNGSDSD